MLRRVLIACCFVLCTAGAVCAGDEVPAWLQQAAQMKTPVFTVKEVPAVVLHHEQIVSVSEDGKIITTTNYAVRILTRVGREMATARQSYNAKNGKVKEIRAWLIRAAGPVKKYGKDETADVAFSNDVYDEVRTKLIIGDDDANEGDVFGYQVTSEERSVFSQDSWYFQDNLNGNDALPMLLSRYTLNLPNGWRANSITFNHPEVKPTVSGSSYTWELRDLPPHPPEPLSPPPTSFVPRIAVSYFPAEGAKSPIKSFNSWAEVAIWLSALEDPQMTVNDALAAKTQELAANAKTELEKIQAVARYAQSIQYISIQTNVNYGGGYRPHSATDIFAKSYGDCKDKANLMRAMLSVLKIPAYMVSIFSGDPTYVRADWASPHQFNHCIIAVKVGDETQAPTVIKHPTLGRLLIFDPTDDATPVGDLPWHQQGSLALIDAKDSTELLRMPVTSPDANRMERQTEVVLDADGSVQGRIQEFARGHSATRARNFLRNLSRPDFNKTIEAWLSAGMGSVKVSKIEPQDFQSEGRFTLGVDFTSPAYAQIMQGRLMVFKPALVSRSDELALSNTSRLRPVQLRARAFTETVRVKLPAGFEVDETPDAEKIEMPFGSYASKYEVKEGYLIFTRTLTQQSALVPAAEYAKVRDFFARIRVAEQNPVVLVRK